MISDEIKRLICSGIENDMAVVIGLPMDNSFRVWLEKAEEAMIVMGDAFTELAEKMYEAFLENNSMDKLSEFIESIFDKLEIKSSLREEWNEIRKIYRNNFRKVRNLPLIRRRCRWRQRESRRAFVGLSPNQIIIDEYASGGEDE